MRRRPTYTPGLVAVASCGVAAFAGDFDDLPGDDSPSQPLPAEDRLWRHPSELGSLGSSLPLDPITVRRRWLASQPSKASAWTAGLVGALLATGLVALGTHLASALTARPSDLTNGSRNAGTTLASAPVERSGLPAERGIGAQLSARMAEVGKAVVYLEVSRGATEIHCLGVGVRANGMLLAPAAEVDGATSIMVMLPDGVYYVGKLVGSDMSARAASSGLALVHIEGVSNMPVAPLDTTRPTTSSMLGVALTAPGGATFSIGSVSAAPGATTTASTILVDAMTTDLAATTTPPGSLLLGANGRVLGIVTATSAGKALATPAWVASIVLDELTASGSVTHGWLGIEGATTTGPVDGVRVTKVASGSAAYDAGVSVGDVIVSVGGERVTTMAGLQGHLYFVRPGTRLAVGIVRDGRTFVAHPSLDGEQMK